MDEFGLDVVHGVRGVLRGMGVYHAPWIIEVSRTGSNTVKVLAYWNPTVAPPRGLPIPTETIQFVQDADHKIEKFRDVNIVAIASALRRRFARMFAPKG